MKNGKLALSMVLVLPLSLIVAGFIPYSKKTGDKKKITSAAYDTSALRFLVDKGNANLNDALMNPPKAKIFLDSALMLCDKQGIEVPAQVHLLNARYTLAVKDYFKSEEEGKLAVDEAKAAGDNYILAMSMVLLARNYGHTGFVLEGSDYLDKAMNLANTWKLKGVLPEIYKVKADIMGDKGDFTGRKQNLELMIESSRSEKDTVNLENGLSQLGTFLEDTTQYSLTPAGYSGKKLTDYKRSRSLLMECLNIAMKARDGYYMAYTTANLGYNYYLSRQYDSAIYYYNQSLNYTPVELKSKRVNALGNLGTIYRDLGKYDLALKYYKKSLNDASPYDFYHFSWVFFDMTTLYLAKKDTGNAYRTYVLYKKYNDELLFSRSTQNIAEERAMYEADSHSKEVALLSLRLKNNRILNISLAIFILLTFTIAGLLIRNSRIQARRRIAEMNHRISEMTQANLRQQMNPHFIFNTLNSIQYFMYQNDKLATNNYLTKFSALMRKVLENSQNTSVPVSDELEALKLYLDLECLRFKDKFDYQINVDEEIDPLLFKVPTMLIQPYVENSIIHGLVGKGSKGRVIIDMKLGDGKIICTIEDNGIGRDAAQEIKKSKSTNHNSLGTKIVSSRLDLVNELYGTSLETHYTDLKDDNGEPSGTRVEIHIPIMV